MKHVILKNDSKMIKITSKDKQASGAFNGGEIVENKPIGFPQDGGDIRPYSTLFYWAYAEANVDSTIGLHPHQGFEIMSFVLKGTIRHYDSKQKAWIPLETGDAQVIRAGNGIKHAEHLNKDSAIFQIWLDPNLNETLSHEATYSDYKADSFPKEEENGITKTTYIGEGSPFQLFTKGTTIQTFNFSEKAVLELDEASHHSIYVQKGSGSVEGNAFSSDDFIQVENEASIEFLVSEATRLFVISSPKVLGYQTYAEQMQARMGR